MSYHRLVVDRAHEAGWQLTLAALMCTSLLGACFSPTVQEGLACSESGSCPIGQVCIEAVCILAGSNGNPIDADASISIVNPDSSPVPVPDADTSCAPGTVLCGEVCEESCVTALTAPGETSYQPEAGCSFLHIEAWGAGGGHGSGNLSGGAGGYAVLERNNVLSTETYTVMVGAPGTNAVGGARGLGGAPGGGDGGTGNNDGGGGGGGYSGVFLGGTAPSNAIMIAGAGGGSGGGNGNGDSTNAGAGGGAIGQQGSNEGNNDGGTATAGFAELAGGTGGSDTDGGGGGGAGWWGASGGSGVGGDDAQGAGGGSGYVESGIAADLAAGNRGVPGNAIGLAMNEMTARPTFAGKVTLTCYATAPVN